MGKLLMPYGELNAETLEAAQSWLTERQAAGSAPLHPDREGDLTVAQVVAAFLSDREAFASTTRPDYFTQLNYSEYVRMPGCEHVAEGDLSRIARAGEPVLQHLLLVGAIRSENGKATMPKTHEPELPGAAGSLGPILWT